VRAYGAIGPADSLKVLAGDLGIVEAGFVEEALSHDAGLRGV
jgi:hypothetical protein